jgi:CheY-like chemotaxis protein
MAHTILLVDDADTILMIERLILDQEGYALITAKNGKQAVEKALAEKPDLILMDIMMPEVDGFEACKRLRQLEATRTIPIIMVTTRSEQANVENGFNSGCNDYVTKPIDRMELVSKIRNYLGE